MTITVQIGGVSMDTDAHFVDEGSVSHVNALGQRDTFSCRIVSKDGSYTPTIGAAIVVSDDAGVRFGGSIRETTVSQFGVAVSTEIQCASWEQIMDRRFVAAQISSNTGETCGEFFQRIFDGFLTFENLTASIVATGPVIDPPISLDWCSVREAFDLICSQASSDSDTYMWDCTPAKVTRFYKQSSFAAPINVTDSSTDVMRPITINQSFGGTGVGYANKAYVRVGQFVTDERSNTYSPDGSQTSLAFELPIAEVPTVTVNAVSKTVGIRDVDTGKDCYWQKGSAEVTFATAPALGTTVVITARGYQTTVIDAGQVDDEVAARSVAEDNSGWYAVLLDIASGDAIATGQAWLAKYANGVPRAVEYVTTTNGLRAGQYQTISLSGFGSSIGATFIVESVSLFQIGPHYGFRVRSVNGALANGWLQKLRQIATGGTSSMGGGSTGGTVVTPGASTVPPGNVTIDSVTPSDEATAGNVRRRIAARRSIDIKYTAPDPIGTFAGVLVQIEAPDQSTADPTPLDGSVSLDGTTSLGGAKEPLSFGPFAHSDVDGSIRVQIDEPKTLPMDCRARLISYSDTVQNDAATAPTQTFTIVAPTVNKPGSARAYAENPTSISVTDTGTRDHGGVLERWIKVHMEPPEDTKFYGVQWIVKDPDGNTLNASGIQPEADFELAFQEPATAMTATVYGCGGDAQGRANPLVEDITPSATVSIGTTSGTIDFSKALSGSFDGQHFDLVDGKFLIAGVPLGDKIATDIASYLDVVSGVLKVKASAITGDLIAAAAIDTVNLVDSAVGTNKIAPFATTAAKIANAAIQNAHLDRATVNKIAIVDADIVSLSCAKLTAGTIAAGVVYAGSIQTSQIAAGTLGAGVVYAGTVNASQINAGTINAALLLTAPTIDINVSPIRIQLDTSNYITITNSASTIKTQHHYSYFGVNHTSDGTRFSTLSLGSLQLSLGSQTTNLGAGFLMLNGNQVMGPRIGTRPVTLADVIAAGVTHGWWV